MNKLTHIDSENSPKMVEISEKSPTNRIAKAITILSLPKAVTDEISNKEIAGPKGPVFQTAIIAGTMAVKKTSSLIPFCHPLSIEGCKFELEFDSNTVSISCEVKTTGKTGVEMEALTGATVAALTVYDMCKALSHEILITETKLVSKEGGKRKVKDGKLC